MALPMLFLGMLIGTYVIGWLRVLFDYVYFRLKGMTCLSVSGIFIRWEKLYTTSHPQGKMVFSVSSRLNQVYPTIVMYKRPERERKVDLFYFSFCLVSSIGLIILAVAFEIFLYERVGPYVARLAGGFCFGGASVFLSVFLRQYRSQVSLKPIREKADMMLRLLANAASPDELLLEPFDIVNYTHGSLDDKVNYLIVYYETAEIKNDLAAMATCVNEMIKINGLGLTDTGHFFMDSVLYSYYSFRQKDPELARKYYQHSKKRIDSHRGLTGRRKLAYYAFYIEGNKEYAKTYAQEGLASLTLEVPSVFPLEREFEEKMLKYLLSQIDS